MKYKFSVSAEYESDGQTSEIQPTLAVMVVELTKKYPDIKFQYKTEVVVCPDCGGLCGEIEKQLKKSLKKKRS